MVVRVRDRGSQIHGFWGDGWLCILIVVAVTQIYACIKTHKPVYCHHYQKPILFITCKYKKHRSLSVWLIDILFWSAKQNLEWFFILCLFNCRKYQSATSWPPQVLSALCGNQHCQGTYWGQCRGPGSQEGGGWGYLKRLKVYSPCSRGILTQWKRQISNNANSSHIWKATVFQAHTL